VRLYRVSDQGGFVEYAQHPFHVEHLEQILQNWIEANPDAVLEDGKLLIIGREVRTNLDTYIDLLGLDREGNLAVIELKRDETPRTTLAQVLEYASYAATLDYDDLESLSRAYLGSEEANLTDWHRQYFELAEDEAPAFNKRQRMVIVGHAMSAPVRQSALYLRQQGLPVTCLEFDYFKTSSGEQLMSVNIVVGQEPVGGRSQPTTSPDQTTEGKFMGEAGVAKNLFEAIMQLAKGDRLPINWGIKGFSLNTTVGDRKVALLYGYPPGVYAKSHCVMTDLAALKRKVRDGAQMAESVRAELQADPLWQPAGGEMKCVIDHELSDEEVSRIIAFVNRSRGAIQERGLALAAEPEEQS
jgi:hypothetical protein